MSPLLEIEDLTVEFWVEGQWRPACRGVDLTVDPGETLCLVGESGSGKTQTSMAVLGLLPANARVSGSIRFEGRELLGLSARELREVRGAQLAMIFQEPMTALNPLYTIGFQIVETLQAHFSVTPVAARARAIELLRMVEMPDPDQRVDYYPHQLSGGQRQRAMIAQAIAAEPKLLIADEPTTALDVTVQAEILALLLSLQQRHGMSLLLVTHDMGVVAEMADRVLVMRAGSVVEHNGVHELFASPETDYTRQLLQAVPRLQATERAPESGSETAPAEADPLVRAEGLEIRYQHGRRTKGPAAVAGVDFTIGAGEVVGLVGESGSGKSTIGRALLGLVPVSEGRLTISGVPAHSATASQWRSLRSTTGMVFQDPASSLNPRLSIAESIGEPLLLHAGVRGAALSARVDELLDEVELPRGSRNRYPHELSGGQRQRVSIARALSLSPRLLVADEPTSALDVSVQDRVIRLLRRLQAEHGFGCLFITHDLAVVEEVAESVIVMRAGQVVESGRLASVFHAPSDPYTRRLLDAVPVPDPTVQRHRRVMQPDGDVA